MKVTSYLFLLIFVAISTQAHCTIDCRLLFFKISKNTSRLIRGDYFRMQELDRLVNLVGRSRIKGVPLSKLERLHRVDGTRPLGWSTLNQLALQYRRGLVGREIIPSVELERVSGVLGYVHVISDGKDRYVVKDGNHRIEVLRRAFYDSDPRVVVMVSETINPRVWQLIDEIRAINNLLP